MSRAVIFTAGLFLAVIPSAGLGQPAIAPCAVAASDDGGQRPGPTGADQDLDRPFRMIFADIGGDLVHVAAPKNLAWIGGMGLAAWALHPLDDDLASEPGDEWGTWSEFFDPGAFIGNGFVLLGAAAATYSVGKASDRPRVAHVGRDLLRTQAVSQLIVHGLKLAISRDRPDQSSDNSFPSGHSAATFASAVVLQRHLGMKWAVPTYGVAAYVAISRMHENRHYLSDVIMGAGIGIASGLSTTRHATEAWTVSPVFVPGGAAVVVSRVP